MKATAPLWVLTLAFNSLIATEKGTDSSDSKPKAEKSESEAPPPVFTFADGTRISGFPKSIDPAKRLLTLQSDSLAGESPLKTKQLLEMTREGESQKNDCDHYAVATLGAHYNHKDNDRIRGQLILLDDQKIVLETWYAGRLTLRRSFVKSLEIFPQTPTFYQGPDGPEGWVSSDDDLEKAWTFKNRTMISKGRRGIAREVNLPEKAKITFTADWKTSPYFRMIFLSNDRKKNYPTSGYFLNVQRTYLALYRNSRDGGNQDLISESIRSLYNAESAQFTIYLDRAKNGTSAIYLNQTKIGTWKGVDDTALKGNWLHFIPQNETPLRFREISVDPWNGVLPQPLGQDEEAKKKALPNAVHEDEVLLTDGKKIAVSAITVKDGIASLTTIFGDKKVPTKSIQHVHLSTRNDQAQMKANDIRAWFHQGGYMTINLKSLNKTTLTGSSQVWGEASFKLKAFSRIEFNVWRPELADARKKLKTDW